MPKSRLTVRCMNCPRLNHRDYEASRSESYCLCPCWEIHNSQDNTILVTQTFGCLLDRVIKLIVVCGWKVVSLPQHGEVTNATHDWHCLDLTVRYHDCFTFIVMAGDDPPRIREAHAGRHVYDDGLTVALRQEWMEAITQYRSNVKRGVIAAGEQMVALVLADGAVKANQARISAEEVHRPALRRSRVCLVHPSQQFGPAAFSAFRIVRELKVVVYRVSSFCQSMICCLLSMVLGSR